MLIPFQQSCPPEPLGVQCSGYVTPAIDLALLYASLAAVIGGIATLGLLTFSCAALRAVLGDDGIEREGERLAKWAGAVPYAGFYTYGEIARNHGIDGFHNQTLAILALS